MIDSLTKVKSLHAFETYLLTCKSPKLFLVDIKKFKQINLDHNDEGGNFVLCTLAKELLLFAKSHEMELFRIKNDQFMLALNAPFELSLMEKIIFALCDLIQNQTYTYQGKSITLDMHIGISFDHFNALEKAQKALLVAKQENHRFITYSEFANTLMNESEGKIEQMVKEAISNEDIVLHFQAVMDRKNTIAYYESLIRLNCNQGLQSPKLFLKIARDKNFYDLLLKNIAEKIILLSHQKNIRIALNLSSFDLLDEKRVSFLLETFGNQNVIFEIQCEREEHLEKIIQSAKIFREKGILLALDNVESPDLLEAFEENSLDFVKVHGDIIRNLLIDNTMSVTCKAILDICQRKKIQSIATHLNSKISLEAVQNLAFDLFQGYTFEQPHLMD